MRILLISYYFPPFNSVGAIRPGKLAAYLQSRGHEVNVLSCSNPAFPLDPATLPVPESLVTRVPEIPVNFLVDWLMGGRKNIEKKGYQKLGWRGSFLNRLGAWFKTAFHWPDGQLGWVNSALRAGRELLAAKKYRFIYVSAPPFSAFRVATNLSREFDVPWIGELRDLWTGNHAYAHPAWRKRLEKIWEKKLFSTAKALVTVSEPWARSISGFGIPVWEIKNGFDPEDVADPVVWGTSPPEEISLGYTGSVYPGSYDLDSFCSGLSLFFAAGGCARLTAVGRNLALLERAFAKHGMQEYLKTFPTVPRSQSLGLQKTCDINVLFLWNGTSGVYPAKFFEYVQAGRPILAVGEKTDELARRIKNESMGMVATCPDEIARALSHWRDEKNLLRQIKGIQPLCDYSRASQFHKLEGLLSSLFSSPPQAVSAPKSTIPYVVPTNQP